MISERAATALATVGTVCWCIQLIPQIWYNWRRKDCTGLPPIMMLLWVVSGIPFAIYFCVSEGNITLQVQPHLFMFFCLISFVQSCYYPPVRMTRWKIIAVLVAFGAVDIGMEIGFILWLRPLYRKGIHWPALIFGILASIFLACGLIPPYIELAKRNGRVVGINFIFLLIDSMGAWLSIVSVILGNMDIMGIVLYCIVAALELGIFISHFVWWCRFRRSGSCDVPDEKVYESNDHDKNAIENNGAASISRPRASDATYDDDDDDDYHSVIGEQNIGASRMLRAVHGVSLQRDVITYGEIESNKQT